MTVEEYRARAEEARKRMHEAAAAAQKDASDETAYGAFTESRGALEAAVATLERAEGIERARAAHPDPEPEPAPEPEPVAARAMPGPAVTQEELIYAPTGTRSFFKDLIDAKEGDPQARERLHRNNLQAADQYRERSRRATDPTERTRLGEQSRAISQTATAGGEFIPPVFLQDQWVRLLRAGRAFADQCISQPLPMGTNQINVPKVTTGASTAVQTDGGAVSNTDLVTAEVTAQYQTIAGRTIASYQLFDLGMPPMDGVIYADLLADYWRTLDIALINGNVTNAKGFLNLTGVNAITYTDANPTGPELYVPFMQAKSGIEKGAFVGVDFSLWHPTTWNWYLSQLDGNSRPLALSVTADAMNAMAQFNSAAQGLAGTFAGVPVIVDANVPTTLNTSQSRIGLFNRQTLMIWEGVPRFKVADQTNIANLQYQLVMYGYYAVAFGRQPKMISVISGTGMATQTGF